MFVRVALENVNAGLQTAERIEQVRQGSSSVKCSLLVLGVPGLIFQTRSDKF